MADFKFVKYEKARPYRVDYPQPARGDERAPSARQCRGRADLERLRGRQGPLGRDPDRRRRARLLCRQRSQVYRRTWLGRVSQGRLLRTHLALTISTSRLSPRSTVSRWAAGSSWRWPATSSSRATMRAWDCPSRGSGCAAGAGGVHRLPRQMPLKIAMGMMLTAKPIRPPRLIDGASSTKSCRPKI